MKEPEVQLAIVIPAYKKVFIRTTLESLSSQTDKRFNVYIGNDAGDEEINEYVDCYKNKLNIKYQYFYHNIGSKSIVCAWDRCINMTNHEPWLWLLPDDDFISSNCVESFYATSEEGKCNFNLLRFRSTVTDSTGFTLHKNEEFPDVESSYVSLMEKINYKRSSTLAEYIFRRRVYERYSGFPELPYAWGSDDAAWYLFGYCGGIKQIEGGNVYLRQSPYNISSNYAGLGTKKLFALAMLFKVLIQYPEFLKDTKRYGALYEFEKSTQFFIFNEMRQLKVNMGIKEIYQLGSITSKFWSGGLIKNMYRFWINYIKFNKNNKT